MDAVPLDIVLEPIHALRHWETLDIGFPLADVIEPGEQLAWLQSLQGGPSLTVLENGRVALAFCPGCLDDSDGWVLACRISITAQTVTWDRFGIDNDTDLFGRYGKAGTAKSPPSGWFEECFDDEFAIVFDRAQYDEAITSERSRLQNPPD